MPLRPTHNRNVSISFLQMIILIILSDFIILVCNEKMILVPLRHPLIPPVERKKENSVKKA